MLSNFVKGDTIELEVTVNVDITGWELRCEIYDKSGSSIKLANLASGGGNSQIEITDATNGVFLITVAKDLTTNFEDKSFIEIEREDTTGKILTIYQDNIFFSDEQITWETP